MDCNKTTINSYFICATQTSNLGDLVINKMLIDELCKYGKVFLDTNNISEDFKRPLLENPNVQDVKTLGFSIKKPSLKGLFMFLHLIKKYNIKVITRSPGPLTDTSFIIRLGFSMINLISRTCGANVIYIGNCCSEAISSDSPLKNTYMNQIFVRSKASKDYAKKFFNIPVEYIPDMAYLMPTPKFEYTKINKVAIDFRITKGDKDIIFKDINKIVDDFLNIGYSVELYYQVKGDKPFVEELYSLLKNKGVTMRENILWYNDLDYYKDITFIVSNRLHSLLFGAVYGAIPIARITNDSRLSKIKDVFESSLSNEFTDNIFVTKPLDVKKLVANKEHLKESLKKSLKNNKTLCEKIIYQNILKE